MGTPLLVPAYKKIGAHIAASLLDISAASEFRRRFLQLKQQIDRCKGCETMIEALLWSLANPSVLIPLVTMAAAFVGYCL